MKRIDSNRLAKKATRVYHDENVSNKAHHKPWFRGEHTNFNPSRTQMMPEMAVTDHVLNGWLPDTPFITPDTQITAFGSCFANNISNWLARRNYHVLTRDDAAKNAYVVSMGEGMVNSFVIRQQFEWAWENKQFEGELWHGYKAETFGYDKNVQQLTKQIFDTTDVFILTFGLSEVWYDEPTGNVFWRTIPKDAYDPSRHKFRVSTVEENRENIEAIYALIRKHRPDAKIIVTLSPIPLSATFRDNSCLSANSVSKSILRVAIDEVVRAHQDEQKLFYWPSYEIVSDVFHLPYVEDRRHMVRPALDFIMTEFEHHWCVNEDLPPPSRLQAWIRACAASGMLPARLERIVDKKNLPGLNQILSRNSLDSIDSRDIVLRDMLMRLRAEWLAQDTREIAASA
jgi:hypothetical protein